MERQYLTADIYLFKLHNCGETYIRYFNGILKEDLLLVTIKNGSHVINPKQAQLASDLWEDIKQFANL